MARYDPHVIHKFADMLEAQAWFIEITTAIAGAATGFGVGRKATLWFVAFVSRDLGDRLTGVTLLGGIAGLLLGVLIGYWIGKLIALWPRVRAQSLLCQVQIEENTRPRTASQPVANQATGPGRAPRGPLPASSGQGIP